ncbi:MAG: hypothetical protein IJ048_08060 [Clostridia bacterium]|nr:hypothetical protein [Clostridia bacterium]
MKKALHGAGLLVILALALILPYRLFIGPIDWGALLGGGLDGVSSASVILDAPSGEYVVLLNAPLHEKRGTVQDWTDFFQGESPLIMEDIRCLAARQDAGGVEMAKSYQSRLPENQMKLAVIDGTLMLSRADEGLFDAIVMSKEFAEALGAGSARKAGVEALEISGVEAEAIES